MTNKRKLELDRLCKTNFDCLIIGGGATGTGTALDLSLRGLKVALVEKNDFSSGTSSRCTKLIHGGVRYLGQLHFELIREALTERGTLLKNAPHLVKPMKFLLPSYSFFGKPYYSAGLTIYDILAGKSSLPRHERVSLEGAISEFAGINEDNLRGGVTYYDAQFNDSRLNVALARMASKASACVLSRVEFTSFIKEEDGRITGGVVRDTITGKEIAVSARVVINTTGPFSDSIRKLDDPECAEMLSPSQGIHLVFPREKIPCRSAMIIPKTSDGRVVFIIPWDDKVIMGTTDTAVEKIDEEPLPVKGEIDFLLRTGNEYLKIHLERKDISSVFIGLRPLVAAKPGESTKNLSREEVISVSPSGLVTMAGGKWSTYRLMAERLSDRVIEEGRLAPKQECITSKIKFIGAEGYRDELHISIMEKYKVDEDTAVRLRDMYGSEVFYVLGEKPKELYKRAPFFREEVVHFVRNEFALSITDVIGRRFRALFTDLQLAKKLVKPVSEVMTKELGWKAARVREEELKALNLIAALVKSLK